MGTDHWGVGEYIALFWVSPPQGSQINKLQVWKVQKVYDSDNNLAIQSWDETEESNDHRNFQRQLIYFLGCR